MDVTAAWYWEGNVVEAILERTRWAIVSKADTHSKERGVDIYASRDDRTLLVEAKGYPSKNYRDPRRAGEVKATSPTNQAQHLVCTRAAQGDAASDRASGRRGRRRLPGLPALPRTV
jgi:hypothetical protein